MDKLVLMVEVWMTLVIIFGSEKVSGTDWFISEEIFHIWCIISSILTDLTLNDRLISLFWNIVLNNWLIDIKPFCISDNEGRKIGDQARLFVRLLKGKEKVFMWSMRMLITITATVLQGFKKETYSCSFPDIYAISSVYCFVYWSLLCNPRHLKILSADC